MKTVVSRLLPLFLVFFLATAAAAAQQIHSCTIIPTEPGAPVATAPTYLPPGARAAVSYKPNRHYDTKWNNGSTITVGFTGGSSTLRQRVMNFASEWTRYANLNFRVAPFAQADIRISFTQNGGSWSMIGSSSARSNQGRPSMNFGWLTDRTPDYEVKRTVLHEFGHALGLLHEHQNPAGGIPWDEDVVYDHYYRTQGWDRRTTYNNVMATADHDATQFTSYDEASIMHYPVSPKLTGGQYSVGMNNELSSTDKEYIAMIYPGRRTAVTATTTPTRRPTTTTTTRPRPQPTRTKPAPTRTRPTTTTTTTSNARKYAVRISNELGNNVKSEVVQLDINNRRYLIRLDRNGRTRQQLDLNLPPGKYDYSVVSSSTYEGYRNVRRGNRTYRQRVEQKVPGSGSGVLAVTNNSNLTLYGSYDKQRKRMRVYLGERGK